MQSASIKQESCVQVPFRKRPSGEEDQYQSIANQL